MDKPTRLDKLLEGASQELTNAQLLKEYELGVRVVDNPDTGEVSLEHKNG